MKSFLYLLTLSLLFPLNIIMRHDVREEAYFQLAEEKGATFIRLNAGCGTFISEEWIVTAAHVASVPQIGEDVKVKGRSYAIKQILIHPEYQDGRSIQHDIALIQLREKVEGQEYAQLYTQNDEVGKDIVFVGTGYAGTGDKGLAGEVNKDRKLRAAQNRIEGTRQDGFIRFKFDAPDSPEALPLEGISGPGDSGGPALWFNGDQTYILGVSSHQDFNGNSAEGQYGALEFYTRISIYSDWIKETIN